MRSPLAAVVLGVAAACSSGPGGGTSNTPPRFDGLSPLYMYVVAERAPTQGARR